LLLGTGLLNSLLVLRERVEGFPSLRPDPWVRRIFRVLSRNAEGRNAEGWGVTALPLHFLLRSGGHGVLAWRESRQGQDEIVEAAAQGVPMLRISFPRWK